ncbi:MAG: thioredoxin [Eggerthellaceae bacterium]|jgi:thioredoxin 1
MTRELTSADFKQEILEGNAPAMIDFYADWCGPCRSMAPTVEQLSADYNGKVKIAKVNVDKNPDIAQQFGVMSIPTFAFFKNGRMVDSTLGAQPRAALEDRLQALMRA